MQAQALSDPGRLQNGLVIGYAAAAGLADLHHEKQAHSSYRLTRVGEWRVFVAHEGDCTKKLRDSGAVSELKAPPVGEPLG